MSFESELKYRCIIINRELSIFKTYCYNLKFVNYSYYKLMYFKKIILKQQIKEELY